MRNGGNIASFMNNGSWNFTKYELDFANNSTSLGLAAADVNRDGRDDLVFNSDGGENGGLWYAWNTSTNLWDAHQRDFSHRITYGGTIAAGDLTGDGYPEIAVGGNSNILFGSHSCGSGATITSGERLMYGQTHANLGGSSGFAPPALSVISAYGLKVSESVRTDINSCHGMDNAQMAIADLDRDGKNDVIIAGSSTGQSGEPGKNGQHYDFAVLFNVNGTGKNFEIWENTGPQDPDGTTNGGPGNLDWPSIAVGDLTGDGYPEVFVQGHHRDYTVTDNPYVYEDVIFVNNGNRTLRSHPANISRVLAVRSRAASAFFPAGRNMWPKAGWRWRIPTVMGRWTCYSRRVTVSHEWGELSDYNTAETLKTYVLKMPGDAVRKCYRKKSPTIIL